MILFFRSSHIFIITNAWCITHWRITTSLFVREVELFVFVFVVKCGDDFVV